MPPLCVLPLFAQRKILGSSDCYAFTFIVMCCHHAFFLCLLRVRLSSQLNASLSSHSQVSLLCVLLVLIQGEVEISAECFSFTSQSCATPPLNPSSAWTHVYERGTEQGRTRRDTYTHSIRTLSSHTSVSMPNLKICMGTLHISCEE